MASLMLLAKVGCITGPSSCTCNVEHGPRLQYYGVCRFSKHTFQTASAPWDGVLADTGSLLSRLPIRHRV